MKRERAPRTDFLGEVYVGQLDRHEARESVVVVRLHHQMGDAPPGRVDDHVAQLSVGAVAAANRDAELQAQGRMVA